MAVNPDVKEDWRIPVQGELRFVERGVPTENEHVLKKVRILQQYQWSQTAGNFGWYDIPLEEEDG